MKQNLRRAGFIVVTAIAVITWLSVGQSSLWAQENKDAVLQIERPRPEVKAQKAEVFMDHQVPLVLQGIDSTGGALEFSILSPPKHGTLSPIVSGGGASATTVYTPNRGFKGRDEFSFAASSSESTSLPQSVTLFVYGPGEDPKSLDRAASGELVGDPFKRLLTPRSGDPRPEAYNAGNWFISGMLGVGTDVPTQEVHIIKPSFPFVWVQNSAATTNTGIGFQNSNTGSVNAFLMLIDGTGDFHLVKNGPPYTPSAAPIFVRNTDGFIGMGTNAPYARLTLASSIGFASSTDPMLIVSPSADTNRMIWAEANNNLTYGEYYDDTNNRVVFQSSMTDPSLTINLSTDQVGINTLTPTAALDVFGNTATTNPRIRESASSSTSGKYPSFQFFDTAIGFPVAQLISDLTYGSFVFDASGSLGGGIRFRTKLDDDNYKFGELDSAGAWIFGGGSKTAGNAVTINGNLRVNGSISKTGAGELVRIEDGDREIEFATPLGPELGTYVRGTAQLENGSVVIHLPEYFAAATSSEGLTVQLTPLSDCNGLWVVEKTLQRIVVREMSRGTSSARFDYLVQGLRKGYENHQVVHPKGTGKP